MPLVFRKDITQSKLRRVQKNLWDDSQSYSRGLGCHTCKDLEFCGGLHLRRGFLHCDELCCGKQENCNGHMCRSNILRFARRHKEIGGFSLNTVPSATLRLGPELPAVVPVVFHGKSHRQAFPAATVAIKLYALFNKRTGQPKYRSRAELCQDFGISPQSVIIASGIDKDAPVERWWELAERRDAVIDNIRNLEISLVTVPNFTLALDRPRQGDLYAIKRIALAWQELVTAGIPTALHVNGRTERDFERWTEFVRQRKEVYYLAYEFTTGAGWAERREQHVRWLSQLARDVSRPLHLIVTGGQAVWPSLVDTFENVTILETSIFMKTIKRKAAVPVGNRDIEWEDAHTEIGQPLDDLFARNCRVITSAFGLLVARPVKNPL